MKIKQKLDAKEFERLSELEKLKYLVSLAALAPSSHNTQPWLFKIVGRSIEVFPNFTRKLSASDPQSREFYLSLGTAIANLSLGASALGLDFITSNRGLSENSIIMFEFKSLDSHSIDQQTLEALITRQCNRKKFEDKPIPQNFLEYLKLQSTENVQVNVISDRSERQMVSELVGASIETAFLDHGFTSELSLWIKPSLAKYQDGMPGYNVGIPYFLSFIMPWMIRNLNLGKAQKKMNEPLLNTSSAFVVLSSSIDDKDHWLAAGQVFENIAVEAEKNGIKVGVFASVIEIGDYYQRLGKAINTRGRPLMFFRIGFNNFRVKTSPRLDLNKVLI